MMRGVVKKWGNSAAVRIPASVLEAAQVRLDQPVDVREEGGRIVIEAPRPACYDIDALVGGITDGNRHGSADMGEPAGQEAWQRRRATSRRLATSSGWSSTRKSDTSRPVIARRSCSAGAATMAGPG